MCGGYKEWDGKVREGAREYHIARTGLYYDVDPRGEGEGGGQGREDGKGQDQGARQRSSFTRFRVEGLDHPAHR